MRQSGTRVSGRVVVFQGIRGEGGHGPLVRLVHCRRGVSLVHLDAQTVLFSVDESQARLQVLTAFPAPLRVLLEDVEGLHSLLDRGFEVAQHLPDFLVVSKRGVGSEKAKKVSLFVFPLS